MAEKYTSSSMLTEIRKIHFYQVNKLPDIQMFEVLDTFS